MKYKCQIFRWNTTRIWSLKMSNNSHFSICSLFVLSIICILSLSQYLNLLKKKHPVIWCGDLNVAHQVDPSIQNKWWDSIIFRKLISGIQKGIRKVPDTLHRKGLKFAICPNYHLLLSQFVAVPIWPNQIIIWEFLDCPWLGWHIPTSLSG